ncbi:MAG: ATP-grasp domain-containing protein [Crenarchaeota archaeon]|nr:ATP-grasp domain-containing protein [Thermoproteota archaeon]
MRCKPRILILYPQRKVPRSTVVLSAALSRAGAVVDAKQFDALPCDLLDRFDLIILRGFPYHYDAVRASSLATCLSEARTINNPWATIKARDKFTSIKLLERAGVPVPKTFLARTRGELLKRVEELGDSVIKPISSSLGFGVVRIAPDEVFYLLNALPFGFEVVVQEYVEKARDVRVLVAGREVLGAMYRVEPLKLASNYAQGADVDPAPPEEYSEISLKAVEALGLEYGGVDLVETPTGPKVIEVNPSPLWFGLSEAIGEDIGMKLAEFFYRKACEE